MDSAAQISPAKLGAHVAAGVDGRLGPLDEPGRTMRTPTAVFGGVALNALDTADNPAWAEPALVAIEVAVPVAISPGVTERHGSGAAAPFASSTSPGSGGMSSR